MPSRSPRKHSKHYGGCTGTASAIRFPFSGNRAASCSCRRASVSAPGRKRTFGAGRRPDRMLMSAFDPKRAFSPSAELSPATGCSGDRHANTSNLGRRRSLGAVRTACLGPAYGRRRYTRAKRSLGTRSGFAKAACCAFLGGLHSTARASEDVIGSSFRRLMLEIAGVRVWPIADVRPDGRQRGC